MWKWQEPDIPVDYFKDHKCKLPRQKIAQRIVCGRLKSWFLNLITVSVDDERARAMFRSYASLKAEKYRQFKYHPFTIHPLSKFRLRCEMFLIVAIYLWYVVYGSHVSAHMNYIGEVRLLDTCTVMDIVTDILYSIHIIMNFFTGYIEGDTQQHVELNLKRIFWHYTRTWFILDVMLITFRLFSYFSGIAERTKVIMAILRIVKLARVFTYANNFLRAHNFGIKTKAVIKIWLILSTYITWSMRFKFIIEYAIRDALGSKVPLNCTWNVISDIWNQSTVLKFAKSLDRSIDMLQKSENHYIVQEDTCAQICLMIGWIIGQFVVFQCAFTFFVIFFAKESAKLKYFVMTKFVKKYMKHRKLPMKLQQMILKYYSVQFQSHFFVESRLLDTVTGQLRQDIIMHTRMHLVEKVQFLNNMPRSLQLLIAMKLKAEVAIAGDIIYKINTVGRTIFFIEKGTVAIYTASGKEYCRVEDGEYFGEGCLLFGNASGYKLRYATTIALSNCELYKLDKTDFETSVACYPMVYNEMKRNARLRYERIRLAEEQISGQMPDLN